MAIKVISLATLKTELVKMGIKSTKQTNTSFFEMPSSGKGSKVILYLPSTVKSGERTTYLKNLATKLQEYGASFASGGNSPKSGAGWVQFKNSTIHIIAKIAGKVNKGNNFEKDLENDLINLKNGIHAYNYPDFIKEFETDYLKNAYIEDVENTGKKNTPRPLKMQGSEVYVSLRGSSKTYDIGEGVADLIVKTKGQGSKFNLSLKYGSTVTFFNSGIQTIMPKEDFAKGNFNDPIAKALINLFSIDTKKFIGVFTGYSDTTLSGKKIKATKQTETVKVNITALQEFIKTVIGQGYLLVHLDNQKHVHITEVNSSFLESASRPIKDTVTIEYPTGGSAKRIDIKVETQKFHLNFNIRNKQGGIYPSHIMCDYKMK